MCCSVGIALAWHKPGNGSCVVIIQNLTDRRCFDEAAALVARLGEDAVLEAAWLADNHRSNGDTRSFAQWRSIERAILMLQLEDVVGEVH